MFQLLYHQLEIHPAFMEIVTSFGFKIVDEDEYFTPSFSTFNTDRALTYEIYYSVQYIELHGRNKPNDPWSFRKYAVHQKYDLDFESSSWLFVQPQEVSREWLRGGNCRQSASGPLHPLSIHLKILKSATVSWRWYLNYLSDELNRIRIRVVCRPDPKDSMLSDDIGFAHSQTLEVIQSKARRANLALKATASVLRCVESCIEEICRRQAKINCEFDASDLCATLKSELTQMGNHLEIHMRKARDIVENVSSVNMLIQRILDLHNYNTLHTNSSKLQLISSSQALETGTMLQLAVTQQKDARVMKVASIIALVYLPASLVASLFSTELFALNSVVLDMRQGIGIFLTLLLTLTASTVLTAYLWLRRDSSIARTNHALPP
ncbi:hypothetical protein AA0114_g7929 [Alternaria tenuissima]|uniref:CorA-like transporter domain-containing protein n=1 Tax=Alternaria tenuissima TaxID=119927 RepID=A0A4Q4MB74_9PLEO|nr:hypothetical protein AA0114_g7929 [Alternaria tenuissima]